ncbi:MAG: hypothetical protein AABY22_07210, partial [Nanoarchaeota archaeon]
TNIGGISGQRVVLTRTELISEKDKIIIFTKEKNTFKASQQTLDKCVEILASGQQKEITYNSQDRTVYYITREAYSITKNENKIICLFNFLDGIINDVKVYDYKKLKKYIGEKHGLDIS